MKLRYDPYQVFRFSKTPAGLYARQKCLGEAKTTQWKIDFKQAVAKLLADQLPDGSWHNATIETIHHLFGLHLTVRSSTAQIDAALTWLLEKIAFQAEEIHARDEDVTIAVSLEGLPFILSLPAMFLTGATLFLSTIFDRESDPEVLALYEWLSTEGTKKKGQWFDEASSHNIFRAMIVHPVFAKDKAPYWRRSILLICRQMRVAGIMICCFIRPLMRFHIWICIRWTHNLRKLLGCYWKSKIAMARGASLSPSGIPFWQFMH